MRAVERAGGLLEPGERLRARHAARAQPVVDRAAVEVLHDDERPPSVLGDVEDRHDVRRRREPAAASASRRKRARASSWLAYRSDEHLHGDRRSSAESVARYTSPIPPWATRSGEAYLLGSTSDAIPDVVPDSVEALHPSAEEEAVAQRVVRVEREHVLARPKGAPLDLGDDGRNARDVGVADHTRR